MINLNTSGIYQIKNIITNKIYIGSAVNIKNRWKTHKSDLNHNKHHSPYLQRAWNKYREESFEFSVLELVPDRNDLLVREQYWLDKTKCYDSNIGYNMSKYAGSRLGVKATDETKKKMSNSQKGNKNSLGHKHSEKSKQKMSNSRKGNHSEKHISILKGNTQGENNHHARLTELEVLEIRRLVREGNMRDIDIANMFCITRHMVYSIKTYRTWKHVS